MVCLIVTDRILTAFETIPGSQRTEIDLPAKLDLHGPITHAQLLRLAKALQHNTAYNATHNDNSNVSETILSSLLRGTKVYIPPPPKKPDPVRIDTHLTPTSQNGILTIQQSPEYLASKARLQAAAEQAAYQRLLHPTPSSHSHADYLHSHSTDDSQLITEDTLTPSLVINIFLSVLITGFSVYWALTLFTMPEILATTFAAWTGPRSGHGGDGNGAGGGASAAVRVLLSLFAALAVAVAETFLYAAYLGKVERARKKERRMKEKKSVIGPVGGDAGEQEEIEIWGKGVNGGVRRRIREKWEKGKGWEVEQKVPGRTEGVSSSLHGM